MVLSSDPLVKNLMPQLKDPRYRPAGDQPLRDQDHVPGCLGKPLSTLALGTLGILVRKQKQGLFRSSLEF